ncbi:cyclopropane-fatty-acyl-phospholipid synthase [Nocardioides baekrokdamisoli]|uniref:Cyclopropane-fatty-acyl-phospholipid synthase n=1 Tax=Nocardioides baekrokdamisoli TaxID=1804624 RepID=A0A3G9IWX0_9ACTN|nr:cyclopropane-fatty-acyl-phospholipid synthase family protein [Nocardioides baekrokdamisoli]BBH16863.1 cyclopropane-fatty-acyl-phospholipid synthase [Nocardioides baekrokdamisoli]
MIGIATALADALSPVVPELPVRLIAWDGSYVGPDGAPLVELRSPDALRRLLWHPGELGAAQAYVTGEAEIHGDLDEALAAILTPSRTSTVTTAARLTMASRVARLLPSLGVIGPPLPAPRSQATIKGRLHSKVRDRASIHHHYDLSNEFYSLILDPSMAYSCGYHATPTTTLAEAQRAKLDLVCTKLGLEPGMTLLDIGCGWGSLSLHAAERFGAHVTAITIAAEQQRFIQERIDARGLGDRVTVTLCDYRDAEGSYDAVSSIEMGEHVGEQNYATYARVIHDRVRPGGRALIQQMSRTGRHPGGGPFIESFIAPDMHMRPVGETVAYLERAGLEVRDVHGLREHYVHTVAGWLANVEASADLLTDLVGEEVVRVWRLYLVGGSAAFRDGRMGVDQILAVRPGATHSLPSVRRW